MSIYSGFTTRKLQQKYTNLINSTINMLMQIVITYVDREKCTPFQHQFRKLYHSIQKMDTIKHTDHKLSHLIKPLANHILSIDQEYINSTPNPKSIIKRPLTSNYIKQSPKQYLQFERNTISITTPVHKKSRLRYHEPKGSSMSVKNQSKNKKRCQEQMQDLSESLTMEQLMEKNRLVQRKMSLFRKKKYLNAHKIHRIKEEEVEEEELYI